MAERCRSAGAVADLDREQSSSVVAVDNGRVHFWVALGEGGFVAGKATQYVGCVVEGVGKFGIGIAAVDSLLHPNVTVYKLVEPCCSIEVAVAVFPTGSVPLPFGAGTSIFDGPSVVDFVDDEVAPLSVVVEGGAGVVFCFGIAEIEEGFRHFAGLGTAA